MTVELRDDLRLALDRVAFAREVALDVDPWQQDLLHSDARRVLLLASRQSGKSTTAAVLALHRALYRPSSLVLVMAPSERQSKELFTKVTTFYRTLGHAIPTDSDRKLGMELENGSRIEALPGTEKTIRGFSGVDLLILDEAARVDDELYRAVRPMLAASGGDLMLLSTPYGRRGFFYQEFRADEEREARGEAPLWRRFVVPVSEVPRISEEFLAEERATHPEWWYRQEYEVSFEEIENSVFSHDLVLRAIKDVEPIFESSEDFEAWVREDDEDDAISGSMDLALAKTEEVRIGDDEPAFEDTQN